MDSIIAQIQTLAQSADESARLDILQSLQQVQVELQSPTDTLMGLASSVGLV